MRDINEKFYMDLISNLKIDCEKCFGFCCSALYFAKAEGFPEDKVAGKPCMNLKEDFKCKIHKSLSKKGVKGCTTFECFGAGQKIAQDTYKGESWLDNKEKASEMFDAFVKMMQLHEMLWYLAEAYRIEREGKAKDAIKKVIDETKNISNLAGDKLIKEIIEQLIAAKKIGDPSSKEAQALAELHKKWLSIYWDKYSKEAHAGVAQMYVCDERFKEYYDKHGEGLAEFLRDAIVEYTSR